QVFWLEVAMHDAVLVHILEDVGQLPCQVNRVGDVKRRFSGQVVAQVLALDEFEDHVWRNAAVEPSVGQEALNAWVIQAFANGELAFVAAVRRWQTPGSPRHSVLPGDAGPGRY